MRMNTRSLTKGLTSWMVVASNWQDMPEVTLEYEVGFFQKLFGKKTELFTFVKNDGKWLQKGTELFAAEIGFSHYDLDSVFNNYADKSTPTGWFGRREYVRPY